MGALLILSTTANATLFGRLPATEGGTDYQAYYDDQADLTWLADANLPLTSGYNFNNNGRMTWADANAWASSLTINGIGGWRLPYTPQTDPKCSNRQFGGLFDGYNCTRNEMGNLFYNALGNSAGSLTITGPFRNVRSYNYWSDTVGTFEKKPATWSFRMSDGYQQLIHNANDVYAWAVQSGDVGAVPAL